MKFVLATHNPNKIREMGAILGQFGVEVVSPKDLGITVDVEETGTTFAENAMLKAKAICELAKLPAIADDSGLCVDALNGGPACIPPGMAARDWTTRAGIPCCCKISGARPPGRPTSPALSPAPSPTETPSPPRGRPPAPSPLPPWGRTASVMTRSFSCLTRQDLCTTDPRGKGGDLPPGQSPPGIYREIGNLFEEITV